MNKRNIVDTSPSAKQRTDQILYCERCGISFLWSNEEQASRPFEEDSGASASRIVTLQRPKLCPACRHLLPASTRERGLVKWFSQKKRYGFLVRANQPDLFVHRSEVQPGVRLRPGDLVEFSVSENERGPSATQVSLLQRASTGA